MKNILEVDCEKLRGGFYTPDPLVDACYGRLRSLLGPKPRVRILEPAAGDGAFIRGLERQAAIAKIANAHITCIELFEEEASKCQCRLTESNVDGAVWCMSFFEWAVLNPSRFEAVVGNPPFVRYQYVPQDERALADQLMESQGLTLDGVSNYWIPFFLGSMSMLHTGGAFAVVLPSEFLATVSGAQVRALLVRNFRNLQVDLFPRDSFPDILQDVVVVSGVLDGYVRNQRPVRFVEHTDSDSSTWTHTVRESKESWTSYLLSATKLAALEYARSLDWVHDLDDVARVEVSIVTGANKFFTVSNETLREWKLDPWALPLLARTGHSNGLVFGPKDHAGAQDDGKRTWLLDFSADRPSPGSRERPAAYIQQGVKQDLPQRYKCRIREPWYRVPHIRPGKLMMAKRAHQHHRLLLNEVGVVTTDTIYRGWMRNRFKGRERDLVTGFHSSLTLLTAELEGRTYGGGVLELVPSEIARLVVAMLPIGGCLKAIDHLSRTHDGQRDTTNAVVTATDELIAQRMPEYFEVLDALREARLQMRQRRFRR